MTRPHRPHLCTCGHRWQEHTDSMAGAPCERCECDDYTPGKPIPRRRSPEADAMRGIVQALTLAGFRLWSTVQGYRREPGGTRMTPGLPDLYGIHPVTGHVLWVEGKAKAGRLRGAQAAFRDLHTRHREIAHATGQAGPPPVYVWRTRAEAEAWLQSEGLMVTHHGRAAYPCATGAE